MLGWLTAAARARLWRAAAAPRCPKFLRVKSISSHDELQPELEPPRIVRSGDRARLERVDVVAGLVECGGVREVERLGAELQPPGFAERETLSDLKVDIPEPRTEQNIPPRVAVRVLRLHCERREIEPAVGRTLVRGKRPV